MPKTFVTRGASATRPRENVRRESEVRKPLYFAFIVDTSGSMGDLVTVSDEKRGSYETTKIAELNEGLAKAIGSLREFEAKNSQFKVYFQVIELNSYGKALFDEGFVALGDRDVSVELTAKGATCLENSLNTLMKYLTPAYMPGCNRAVNVILMSDGQPTDVNGYFLTRDQYTATVKKFKDYLTEKKLKRNIDLYAIGVSGACEDMLRLFADEGKLFRAEQTDSLAVWIDRVTRVSFKRSSAPEGLFRAYGASSVPHTPSMPLRTPTAPQAPAGSGVKKSVELSRCKKSECLACVDKCPKNAILYAGGLVAIDESLCDGCDACLSSCEHGAITDAVALPFGH